jgi:hypothetical protein
MKDIIYDIKDIAVELEDIGFTVKIEPSNDIQIKIASFRTNKTPFTIEVIKFNGFLRPFHINDIKEVFERIIDYVSTKGIYCDFSVSHSIHKSESRYFPNVSVLPDIGNPKNIMWAKLVFFFHKKEIN